MTDITTATSYPKRLRDFIDAAVENEWVVETQENATGVTATATDPAGERPAVTVTHFLAHDHKLLFSHATRGRDELQSLAEATRTVSGHASPRHRREAAERAERLRNEAAALEADYDRNVPERVSIRQELTEVASAAAESRSKFADAVAGDRTAASAVESYAMSAVHDEELAAYCKEVLVSEGKARNYGGDVSVTTIEDALLTVANRALSSSLDHSNGFHTRGSNPVGNTVQDAQAAAASTFARRFHPLFGRSLASMKGRALLGAEKIVELSEYAV